MKLAGHESILEIVKNVTKVLMCNRVHTFSVLNPLMQMEQQATGNMLETHHYNQYNLNSSLVIQFFQSTIRYTHHKLLLEKTRMYATIKDGVIDRFEMSIYGS